jgi:type IV secretion system protein TrbE
VQSRALYRGLVLLAEMPVEHRTITSLKTQVQDEAVRNGLSPFVLDGPLGQFLDADSDVLLESDFITFEIEALMAMRDKVSIPVLTYLFHRIDQRLNGRPTIIVLDEAWSVLLNVVFGAKLEQWLRECRKKNAVWVMATQSLSEIANSSARDVILQSIPTKLYLPSPAAHDPLTRELYVRFGLSNREIDLIAEARPKSDYFYTSTLGKRVFQFGLEAAALAFIGAGGREDLFKVRRMIAEHGEHWPVEWLRACGLEQWADYLARSYPH